MNKLEIDISNLRHNSEHLDSSCSVCPSVEPRIIKKYIESLLIVSDLIKSV